MVKVVLNWHLWRGKRCSSRCRQSPEPSASALPLCCPSSYVVQYDLTVKGGQIWLKIKTRFAFLFGWFLDSWLFSIPDIAKFLHLLVHTYIFLDCDLSLESYENPRGSFRHCPHWGQCLHRESQITTKSLHTTSHCFIYAILLSIPESEEKDLTNCEVRWKLGCGGLRQP